MKAVLLFGLVVLVAQAQAAVLCKTRSGTVKIREACRTKECPVDLAQFGAVGPKGDKGDPGSPESPDDVRAKFFAGTACAGNDPDDVMVKVGNICVDVYEASVWSTPTGGTVYGIFPCNLNGNDCTNIYARSVAGFIPARGISWFQAQQACRNAGKRLLTNAEWQMAAAGTPDPGAGGDGAATCNTNTGEPKDTASTGDCVSTAGVRDMVGNVSEWVADWMPLSTGCPGWGEFSDDLMCLAGAVTAAGPGALLRGGAWFSGADAGVFDVRGLLQPWLQPDGVGFRCAR